MKYLLILLFLFSTHSFSGEADGKGIDCNVRSKTGYDYQIMLWFNDSKVIYVNAFKRETDFISQPEKADLSESRDSLLADYSSNANKITWILALSEYELDRKSLELTMTDTWRGKTEVYYRGSCRVFIGFTEVSKRQNEIIEKIKKKEVEDRLKEEKAREGNKI